MDAARTDFSGSGHYEKVYYEKKKNWEKDEKNEEKDKKKKVKKPKTYSGQKKMVIKGKFSGFSCVFFLGL